MSTASLSEKQLAANRANAQHSTGPVTAVGKTRSARNALSHGLTTKDLYVPEDQQEEFAAFYDLLEQDLYPDGPAQTLLFNHILSASWRLLRCDRAEAALAARTATPGLDPLLDPALEPTLRTIERTRTQAARQLHKSLAELRKLQTEHEYRAAAMPAAEGYETGSLGLGDWQIIRERMKKERAWDALAAGREMQNQKNEAAALLAEADAASEAFIEEQIRAIDAEAERLVAHHRAHYQPKFAASSPKTAETNPSAASAPESEKQYDRTNPLIHQSAA